MNDNSTISMAPISTIPFDDLNRILTIAQPPHQFHNSSAKPVRLLCVCSPAGLEHFFLAVGTHVATRTAPPPTLDATAQAAFKAKSEALAPKYRTELLQDA